jgi:predicted RNA-binding protein
MCESNAYLIKEGIEELVMESVDFLKPLGGKIFMRSIFGEEKTLDATLRELDLSGHKIVLEA